MLWGVPHSRGIMGGEDKKPLSTHLQEKTTTVYKGSKKGNPISLRDDLFSKTGQGHRGGSSTYDCACRRQHASLSQGWCIQSIPKGNFSYMVFINVIYSSSVCTLYDWGRGSYMPYRVNVPQRDLFMGRLTGSQSRLFVQE